MTERLQVLSLAQLIADCRLLQGSLNRANRKLREARYGGGYSENEISRRAFSAQQARRKYDAACKALAERIEQ